MNEPEGFFPHDEKTMMSPTISDLATALAKAQRQMTGAKKGTENDFFKSKYADLAACWDACREPLAENGLAVIQTTESNREAITVVTTLAHQSGEWIRGRLTMLPDKPGAQALGSCLTYARRYALAAIVGLAQVDDDAESATFRMSKQTETKIIRAMEKAIADDDMGAVWEIWDELEEEEKNYLNSTLDRTRKAAWKKAIMAASEAFREQTDPNIIEPERKTG